MKNYFTSESVSVGHPDKICDQISDLLLDYVLSCEPESNCAFECFATKNLLVVGGEVTVKNKDILDHKILDELIREYLRLIKCDYSGFHYQRIKIQFVFHKQSLDIAQGVNRKDGLIGAGDQGIMFGYANNETEHFMPSAIYHSHQILKDIWNDIKDGKIVGLKADAKSQVTLNYTEQGIETEAVVLSIHHDKNIPQKQIKSIVLPHIQKNLPNQKLPDDNKIFINPTGSFTIGGPVSDVGLTGRKIIVDTYGGYAPHGGGAFSGKSSTKVDRSAAYMARYLAKNIVNNRLSSDCLIQLSYGIGLTQPLSVNITGEGITEEKEKYLQEYIKNNIDLSPQGIINRFDLNKPIYLDTTTFGHFGNSDYPWEKLDLIFN
jgi:S-adenosylmethionine synthetase